MNMQEILLPLLLILCIGITMFLIVMGFLEPTIVRNSFRQSRLRNLEDKDLELLKKKTREENALSHKFQKFAENYQERNDHRNRTARAEKAEKELAHKLYSAGIAMTPAAFNFMRNAITFLCLFAALFLVCTGIVTGTNAILLVLVGAAGPMIIARFYVSGRVTLRKSQMENQLPDILDLLAISVGAGMGFDQALGFITESMTGPLVNELAVLRRELSLGKSRTQAFTDLGDNCDSKAISNFAAAVVQAVEMGIPLHDMLVTQATAARNEHVALVRQKAAKASIRMIIPMVCFIFPVLFIVLMGPAVMNLMNKGF